MHVPNHLRYNEDHLWVEPEGKYCKIGITDFAQRELGEIVFIELPEVGAELKLSEPMGSLESLKTVSELYAPLNGIVLEINEKLLEAPNWLNRSSYEEGWLMKVEVSGEEALEHLWNAEKYKQTYGHSD